MNEGVSTDDFMEGSPSNALMDLGFMDELLPEEFWLQKTDGSESLAQSPFNSSILFDPSLVWPEEEPEPEDAPLKGIEDDKQKVTALENPNYIINGNSNNASCSLVLSKNYSAESSDLTRRWSIGPTVASTSSMDRLIRALYYIKDCLTDRDVLIQVWVPVNKGSRRVLTTSHQPFYLDLNCARLSGYRDASVNYKFSAEEGAEDFRGLPGRVFAGKVPEWTPDVQFFRKDEYPRVDHAQQLDVRGSFGVPVFEHGDHNCLGVVEVVFVAQKIKYSMELDGVCRALEAVDLRSSSSSTVQNTKVYDYSYETAVPEITKILRAVSEKHSLPLAQAWASCTRQRKEGSQHTNENLIHCVSTVDSAYIVGDPHIQGFHEACSEHHLLKGRGIVGRAFVTNQTCFSPDITTSTKTEYPLSHYARMFGLHAAVAIPLQHACADSADFVLEFFLPMDCKDPEEHKNMVISFYDIIQKMSQTSCAVTYRELHESTVPNEEGLSHGSRKEVKNVVDKTLKGENWKLKKAHARKSPESRPSHITVTAGLHEDLIGKTGEKRRSKAEKVVTLEILQQYFAGSLKDAAMSIGVCPTTLKRICRQHGIKRWPSRKIKKVGNSLQKIQRVIDSVQGQSGALPVESLYINFPELALPNLSKSQHQFPISDSTVPVKPGQPDPCNLISAVASVSKSSTSSSSSSQNSASSQPILAGTQQHPLNADDSVQEQLMAIKNGGYLLKRVDSSHSWQHLFSNEGPNLQPTTTPHTIFDEQHLESNNVPRGYRLKVTYGEEIIRFRMQSQWVYGDLMREIGTRFGINDTNGFVIKYLDDDLEWVLLTCDDDLEECIDVHKSSGNQILRLSFVRDSQ